METFDNDGEVLMAELIRLNITPYKLSKILGLKSPDSIYHIIKGRNKISKNMIDKLENSSLGFNTSLFSVNKHKQDKFDIIFRTGELLNQISFQVINSNIDKNCLVEKFKILDKIGSLLKLDSHSSEEGILKRKEKILSLIVLLYPSLKPTVSNLVPSRLTKLNFLEIADWLFVDDAEMRLKIYFNYRCNC